jgi:hypothetical protein
MDAVEKTPSVKLPGTRDGRASVMVHLLGLGATGVSVGLVFGFRTSEETALPVLGMGLAAGFVAILWSVVLVWRGAKHGGSLGSAVWLSWVVLTELSWGLAWLWVAEVCGKSSFGLTPGVVRMLLDTGVPIWLFAFWICTTVTLPFSWWWSRRSKKTAPSATATSVSADGFTTRLRGLTWRALVLLAPCLLATVPVALVLHGTTSFSAGQTEDWLIGNMPAYAQSAALKIRNRLPLTRGNRAYLHLLHERVLLQELDRLGDVFWLDEDTIARHSDLLLSWARDRISGATYPPSLVIVIQALVQKRPLTDVRELLTMLVQSPKGGSELHYLMAGIIGRSDAELRSLRPDFQALKTKSGVDQIMLLSLFSEASTPDERHRIWMDELAKVKAALPAKPGFSFYALSHIRRTQGIDLFVEEALQDPDTSIQQAILAQCGSNWTLAQMPSEKFHRRLIELAADSNLVTRRAATLALTRRMGLSQHVVVMAAAVETQNEIADRARIVKAARKLLEKSPADADAAKDR